MTYVRPDFLYSFDSLTRMPRWISARRNQAPEDQAFLSGAALAHLDLVVTHQDVPQALLRERLALDAASACTAFAGRPERTADLRDAIHLLRAGDLPGPAGAVYMQWRQAVSRPMTARTLSKALPDVEAKQLGRWLDAGHGAPVARAAAVLEAVLADAPRHEAAALILADAALSRACCWDHVVPLLAPGLNRRDLGRTGADLRDACHVAIRNAAARVVPMAADLARRAARLRSVAPKLRAKGASAAVELFLTHDALAPTALTGLMSDRAARRFCDRLIELGVARELTGRETFRLYGL